MLRIISQSRRFRAFSTNLGGWVFVCFLRFVNYIHPNTLYHDLLHYFARHQAHVSSVSLLLEFLQWHSWFSLMITVQKFFKWFSNNHFISGTKDSRSYFYLIFILCVYRRDQQPKEWSMVRKSASHIDWENDVGRKKCRMWSCTRSIRTGQ